MSNDVPEGEAPPERGSRRSPRLGDSGAPIGSTLSIILAIVAVVAGFLILRAISDDDDGGSSLAGPASDTTAAGLTTTTLPGGSTTTSPPTTAAGPAQRGARVIVANANNTGGSAARMSRALESAGWTVIEATDAVEPENQLEESKVYFVASDARAQAVANSVAEALGGVNVAPMPAEIPVEDGDIGRATVLVMLGVDAADKTLDDLAEAASTGTNPPVAGGTTATTAG
jgi:hypothetical protein